MKQIIYPLLTAAFIGCSSMVPAAARPPEKPIEVDTAVFTRQAKTLQELVVKPKKQKYSKKDNPAVQLMQRIRVRRDSCSPMRMPFYKYNQYDRITLGLNDWHDDENGSGKLDFLKQYIDTAPSTGKRVLNVSVKERASVFMHRSDPSSDKTIVTGRRSEGLDRSFDAESIQKFLEDALREVDIYQDDITLMQNRFVSPLSRIGADYYMYFLTDTLDVDGVECYQLTFRPHNRESFGFQGSLFVESADPNCFIRRVEMRVPRSINLNYVDNVMLVQSFEKDSIGNRHKMLDDLSLELKLMPGTPEFYARRVTARRNFSNDSIPGGLARYFDRLGNEIEIDEAYNQSDIFWNDTRFIPLSQAESSMGSMLDRLREFPLFYWSEKVLVVLVGGYWGWKPDCPVLFGPANTLVSANTVEGARFRVGGMTTAALSPHWFIRGYGAYGTKDRKWKYQGELEYSFNRKKNHSREFPVHSLRATYGYDLDMIGQHYLFTNADNVFLSLKRMKSNLVTYRRMAKLEYTLELANNFSVNAFVRHERQEATPWLEFINGYGASFSHYDQAWAGITLRYAPGEKFVQQKTVRLPVNMDAPIFQITHEFGHKGWLGSAFTLNRTEISVQKRFWFSAFGYTDIILKGGKIWSRVLYPALMWPNANLSYTIQPESYSLMNPMEFANDRYAAIDLTYWGNGVLFNRIPLVKKLRLREVLTFKGLMGGLSDGNNPEYNDELYRFPSSATPRVMTSRPYMEIGAGIDNILTILRVDYLWRLTYRDTPGCDRHGLRVSLHFTF